MVAVVRAEQPGDSDSIGAVHRAAFPTSAEAEVVARLRRAGAALVSLVALQDGQVVGHVVCSPAWIEGVEWRLDAVLLGPLAVVPAFQRQGIGSQLMEAALGICRARGHPVVGALAAPDWYRRFGFAPSARFGIANDGSTSDTSLLLLALRHRALAGAHGVFHVRPEVRGVCDRAATVPSEPAQRTDAPERPIRDW